MEIWNKIEGYTDYEVSNTGYVRSLKCKKIVIMKYSLDKAGYARVNLFNKGKAKTFFVHQLVAKAFIPNPYNKLTVNHKDKDRTNNHVDNLEWNTLLENLEHKNSYSLTEIIGVFNQILNETDLESIHNLCRTVIK